MLFLPYRCMVTIPTNCFPVIKIALVCFNAPCCVSYHQMYNLTYRVFDGNTEDFAYVVVNLRERNLKPPVFDEELYESIDDLEELDDTENYPFNLVTVRTKVTYCITYRLLSNCLPCLCEITSKDPCVLIAKDCSRFRLLQLILVDHISSMTSREPFSQITLQLTRQDWSPCCDHWTVIILMASILGLSRSLLLTTMGRIPRLVIHVLTLC